MIDSRKLDRRAFLGGLGLGAFGVSAGLMLTESERFFGPDLARLSFAETLQALDISMTPAQRALTVLNSDHPVRQITNTIPVHQSPHIGTLFNIDQAALIKQLYRLMLSQQGQRWFKNTVALEGKFEGSIFKIYSDDSVGKLNAANAQVVINGGHYMLRSGDLSSANQAYAFGGPIAYGQQLGNNKFKVAGNAFKAHGDAMHAFHAALTSRERLRAYQVSPPFELVTQIQGTHGRFAGVRIGDTSSQAQAYAYDMLETLFAAYSDTQRRDALSAIAEHGGVSALHVALYSDYSFYEDGSRYVDLSPEQKVRRGRPYTQVWRIEGPACVIHFQGYPHVHAYINVVRDPSKIAIGEVLTQSDQVIQAGQVRRLMHQSILNATDEALAYYPDMVQGRLSPGDISTGSVYALDPYRNTVVVAQIRPQAMSTMLQHSLHSQGIKLHSDKIYRVATMSYMLERPDLFGVPETVHHSNVTVRDALVNYLRDRQMSAFNA